MNALINLWRESGKFKIGLVITLLLIVIALLHKPLTDLLVESEKDPTSQGAFGIMQDSSSNNWFGTDRFGRDVLALVLKSLPVSLTVAFLAGAMSTLIAVVVGFSSGFMGGKVDATLRTLTDMFIVIPTLPLIIILAANTRSLSVVTLAMVLAAFGWPGAARVIRTQVLSLRERPYIELSRMTNLTNREIIVGDILPNMAPYVAIGFAQASVGAAFSLAFLSILGIGSSSQFDLGRIINEALGLGAISTEKYFWFGAPVVLLILLFLGLALISQGMEEFFNPRLRSQA